MSTRAIRSGGVIYFSSIQWYELKEPDWNSTSLSRFHFVDVEIKERLVSLNEPPQLFEFNDTILTKSQGATKPWWD